MPVIIRRKTEAPAAPLPAPISAPPTTTLASVDARPKLDRTMKFGQSEVRPDMDLHHELNKVKFIVHLRKPGIWYRIIDFDEQSGVIKAQSVHVVFDTSVHRSLNAFYMVVVEPEGTTQPSKDALHYVQEVLGRLPPGAEVHAVTKPPVAPIAPKKTGGVTIRKRTP